ncbi:unnamed protein product [Rhodiola kirilowii]
MDTLHLFSLQKAYTNGGSQVTYLVNHDFSIMRFIKAIDQHITKNTIARKMMTDAIADHHDVTMQREVAAITISRSNNKCCFVAPKQENMDDWEKSEMDKIKKRYEKMKMRSVFLENEEKRKAVSSFESRNIKLEDKRGREILGYKLNVAKIDAIVTGALSVLDRKMRKQEEKVEEKAKKMKSVGKFQSAAYFLCI